MARNPSSKPRSRTVRSVAVTAATGASWMALVAATTLGLTEFDSVRALVFGEAPPRSEGDSSYRLVVQSYADAGEIGLPGRDARPVGSTQRSVTAEELRRGVAVQVVQLGAAERASLVVAWVERGAPDLAYDGLRARPPQDAFYGAASGSDQGASVVLGRRPV